MPGGRFWQQHLVAPLILFLLLAALFEQSHIDLLVADWIYRLEGGRWALRHQVFLADILHRDAAWLMKGLALLLLGLAAASGRISALRSHRKALWYLALAMPTSALLVHIGKEITRVDCPWDLLRYGGSHPYLKLFTAPFRPDGGGHCFPAGHASGGYALVALYFFFLQTLPRWRFYGLGIGLGCGLLFGLTQQLRGAHFLSHDLWTLAICWFNSLAWHSMLFKNRSPCRPCASARRPQSDYG